jgi:hypothetical protein
VSLLLAVAGPVWAQSRVEDGTPITATKAVSEKVAAHFDAQNRT